jgi:Fanconi anemia group M protein
MKKIELKKSFEPRKYQQSIFANSINNNTLVVLPTGLGKTIIAVMLCVYLYNKNNKKILFLAPTKPLVEQQEKSFASFFSNSDDFNFKTFTGLVSPNKRENLYNETDFAFSTPQLIENDIINGIIKPQDYSLVVIDEAHRATGNYAYCFIAERFNKAGAKILALTASPGTSKDEIKNIIDNLSIENLEVKKYEDKDVAPYVNKTNISYEKVELPESFLNIKKLLDNVFSERIKILKDLGFLEGKNPTQITKKDLLELQSFLRTKIGSDEADEIIWKAISIAAGLMKLSYGMELFESQELSASHSYFYNFFRDGGDKSKAASELSLDIDFRDAFDKISQLKSNGIIHPKLSKLKEIVTDELIKNNDLKIIIFSQYRESAQIIVYHLEKIKEIKPVLFVGQSKKGEVKMSQKQQKEILEDFRMGKYNCLVSTSVGEEGLDIPKVDMVVFYEPIPSAIRTIQRVGRTGRFKEGKAVILMSDQTRDIITRHVASAKERRMYRALDELKSELLSPKEKENKGLGKFIEEKASMQKVEINGVDERVRIIADNRENNDLLKELCKIDEIIVETKQLDVGDIVITQEIAIERKSKKDFVNSVIDKRLFPQLINLAKNYKRPVLIIEGEENIYSIRNVNPNVIRAVKSAIAFDLRMLFQIL